MEGAGATLPGGLGPLKAISVVIPRPTNTEESDLYIKSMSAALEALREGKHEILADFVARSQARPNRPLPLGNYVDGASAVAKGLRVNKKTLVNKTLGEINLVANLITDAGAQAVGEALKVNYTLTYLHLSFNAIGDAGAQAIGDGLNVPSEL
eukprot:g58730.t1